MKKNEEKSSSNKGDKVQNLSNYAAIDKIKELVKHNSICMFVTHLEDLPLESRPMSVAQVDDEGNMWFISGKSTTKNQEISTDPRVQLFFSNVSDQEYLTVYGTAGEVDDKAKLKEVWTPIAKAWFEGGIDDPDVSLLKVQPEDAFYWDTKNGRMISLIKILASAVVGKTIEEGVQGNLKIQK